MVQMPGRVREDGVTVRTLQCQVDSRFYEAVNVAAAKAKVSTADFVRNVVRDAIAYKPVVNVATKTKKFASKEARTKHYNEVGAAKRALTKTIATSTDDAVVKKAIAELRALR